METIKVYHLWWDKFNFEDIEKFASKKGLYAVYADHVIYGRNVLVYIGKTKRDIKMRLSEHVDFSDTNIKNMEYYYGEILEMDDACIEKLDEIIDEIETLLINSHCPAYNSTSIKGLIRNEKYYKSIILNWNDHASLLPEVSGLRFSALYWDDWDKKAKHFG